MDNWSKQGQGGRWTCVHRTSRRSLFTPFKVSGGPSKQGGLKKIRITRGKSHAHRMLEGSWIGTTDFRETVECIDDDTDSNADDDVHEQGDINNDLEVQGNLKVQGDLNKQVNPKQQSTASVAHATLGKPKVKWADEEFS